jgi:hypothetical protein
VYPTLVSVGDTCMPYALSDRWPYGTRMWGLGLMVIVRWWIEKCALSIASWVAGGCRNVVCGDPHSFGSVLAVRLVCRMCPLPGRCLSRRLQWTGVLCKAGSCGRPRCFFQA